MGWEAGKSLTQNCQWWKIRPCNEIWEVNIKQEDWDCITYRAMGGTSDHVKWNKPHLSKHVFSYVWHTYHKSRKGTLSGERRPKKRKWEGNGGRGIKTIHICFLSHAGVLFEGKKEEQWEEQKKKETVMGIKWAIKTTSSMRKSHDETHYFAC